MTAYASSSQEKQSLINWSAQLAIWSGTRSLMNSLKQKKRWMDCDWRCKWTSQLAMTDDSFQTWIERNELNLNASVCTQWIELECIHVHVCRTSEMSISARRRINCGGPTNVCPVWLDASLFHSPLCCHLVVKPEQRWNQVNQQSCYHCHHLPSWAWDALQFWLLPQHNLGAF